MYPYLHLGPIHISTYFLLISLGVTLSALWFIRRAEAKQMMRIVAIDLTLVVFVCGFIGARLLHVYFEEPEIYRAVPLKILQFWEGGFVYFGGLFAALVGAWFFCNWRKEPFLFWADTAAPPCALAYAIGRLGCFFNGCCYGKYCELPWAIQMHGEPKHPTQLYAATWEFLVLFLLLKIERQTRFAGSLMGSWLILHAIGRIVMENFRGDPRGPLIYGLSLGTWISVSLILAGITLLAQARAAGQGQKPGPQVAI